MYVCCSCCYKMKINRKLLPIKAHYFFFMGALGPILPQLTVIGKELGISTVVMGSITGLLPIAFLLVKPVLGIIVDMYRNYRKFIFILLINLMTICYTVMTLLPAKNLDTLTLRLSEQNDTRLLKACNRTDFDEELFCSNVVKRYSCVSNCTAKQWHFLIRRTDDGEMENISLHNFCSIDNLNKACTAFDCIEEIENSPNRCLYKTYTFWIFVFVLCMGMIAFNTVNSISDAICCDVIGDNHDYGRQRMWGSIGYGLTSFIGGSAVNLYSAQKFNYIPVTIILIISSILDICACSKLKLPVIEAPKSIFKDLAKLANNRHVVVFFIYSTLAGFLDSFIFFFLFWYIEDLSLATNTKNVKLIEGLIIGTQCLAELVFFRISGWILTHFGHIYSFSLCFFSFTLRLALMSIIPSPWWIIPIEFFIHGPTYALSYSTIVMYANDLAPTGASATMQAIAAGMDDGLGYAIGCTLTGFLYKYYGGSKTMQMYSVLAFTCSILLILLHKTVLKHKPTQQCTEIAEYNSIEEAIKVTDN